MEVFLLQTFMVKGYNFLSGKWILIAYDSKLIKISILVLTRTHSSHSLNCMAAGKWECLWKNNRKKKKLKIAFSPNLKRP